MKILHINWSGVLGGAEKLAYLLAEAQIKGGGDDVTIAYMTHKSSWGRKAEAKGIKVIEFNMKSGFDIFNFTKYLNFIRRERFNIIHDHSGPPLVSISKLFSSHSIVIQHIHGTRLEVAVWQKRRVLLWKRLSSGFIDHYIANSFYTKRIVVKKEKVLPKHVSVVHNGIKLNEFKPSKSPYAMRKELGLNGDEYVVGIVGRLASAKGIDKFIGVAAKVTRKLSNARFIIVGEGILREELESKVSRLHLTDKVIFTDAREDIPNILSIFDIFLLTSNWEFFGIVLIEAMALGVPIISFAVGGVTEVVDESCAVLVSPGDVEAMSREVISLLKDEKRRKVVSAGGVKRAKKFDISKVNERIEDIYLRFYNKDEKQT